MVNDLISSLGKGTAGGLRFLAGSPSDKLREGLPLERIHYWLVFLPSPNYLILDFETESMYTATF